MTGRFIVVVGPDGVGKTTVASAVIDLRGSKSAYFHFRPPLTSPLSASPGNFDAQIMKRRDGGPKGIGWIRLFRSLALFWMGYLRTIRPAIREGTLVIGDRWGYGYLIQPAALKFSGPEWLARWVVRALPKPDLVVNLAAPIDEIARRKQELSPDEIEEELSAWRQLPVSNMVTLDASKPPDATAAAILGLAGLTKEVDLLPTISVVMPSYNQARFLAESMDSVLDQDYPKIEMIVIDGGSTDGSLEIVRERANRLGFWVSEADDGQTDALIKGFARSSGDILCWLNSDDVFEPSTLWQVASFFLDNPRAEVVYGDATWISAEGDLIRSKKEHAFNRFVWMYDHNFVPQPSTFWRRELYWRVGGLDPSFDLAMDGDLWARFQEVADFHHVRSQWSRMRLYAEQKNQRLRRRSDVEDARIRDRYLRVESVRVRRFKKLAARLLRISLKLIGGCYDLRSIAGASRSGPVSTQPDGGV